jgi:hypothetical protein
MTNFTNKYTNATMQQQLKYNKAKQSEQNNRTK